MPATNCYAPENILDEGYQGSCHMFASCLNVLTFQLAQMHLTTGQQQARL